MKAFIFAGLLVVAVSATLLEELGEKFRAFKLEHGKTYKNQAEETLRFNIFKNNVRAIEEHNALYEQGHTSYKKGINKFTDMTKEEFTAMLKLSSSPKLKFNGTGHIKTGLSIPDSVDWRSTQVTEVKDQGFCGSCWAFSITGSTEAAYYRKNGKLVSLSEQQLVDCTTDLNSGCSGGYLEQNFDYCRETGLESEESYPYTGWDGDCQFSASKVVAKVSEYKVIDEGKENDLLDAVANIGPVSVGMDASDLSAYESGIYKCSSSRLDHAVLAVGYGSENGVDYWIIKNSWGKSWGENGYFKLVRGANECGVAEDTTYPTVN